MTFTEVQYTPQLVFNALSLGVSMAMIRVAVVTRLASDEPSSTTTTIF